MDCAYVVNKRLHKWTEQCGTLVAEGAPCAQAFLTHLLLSFHSHGYAVVLPAPAPHTLLNYSPVLPDSSTLPKHDVHLFLQ